MTTHATVMRPFATAAYSRIAAARSASAKRPATGRSARRFSASALVSDETDRADRDGVAGDAAAARVAEHLRGADHRVVVVEGLALPLEDDARDAPRRLVAHLQQRVDHLPRREVAREPESPRRAEGAAHRAADLRRETDRETTGHVQRNAHRLGERAVGRAEQILHEAIGRIGDALDDLEAVEGERRFERFPLRARERAARRRARAGHVREVLGEVATRLVVAQGDTVRRRVRDEVGRAHPEEVREPAHLARPERARRRQLRERVLAKLRRRHRTAQRRSSARMASSRS
jgi:hypothetical protein